MDRNERRDRFAAESRASHPDLGLLCMLVAAEADPACDEKEMDRVRHELDRLGSDAARQAAGTDRTPQAWAAVLRNVLGSRHGFHGRPSDYDRLEASLLHEVLRRGRGLPILLSVVWMEVGRQAGAPVYGLGLPGKFVVGFGDPDGSHVLADPFNGGRPMTEEDAERLVALSTGAPAFSARLTAAEPLEIITRLLNNIRTWAARPEHATVRLWAVELTLLLPHHPARLRLERAQLMVECGDFLGGANELDSYAEIVGTLDPAAAETVRHEARAARALLN